MHLSFLRVGRVIALRGDGHPEQAGIVDDGIEREHCDEVQGNVPLFYEQAHHGRVTDQGRRDGQDCRNCYAADELGSSKLACFGPAGALVGSILFGDNVTLILT